MIEIFQQQIKKDMSREQKLNVTRELLQLMALKILYDKDILDQMAFVGGTALRFLHDLKRFSEDLDFSLVGGKGYNFQAVLGALETGFKLYGLRPDLKPKEEKTVQSCFLKFGALLKELDISPLADEKVTIKFEIDTNPPEGAAIQKSMVNRTYFFYVIHHDLPSLYATKLCACFYRKYTKGRDFYDLIWYLGKKIKPNYELLNNAITQTQKVSLDLDEHTIKGFLLEQIEKVDLKQAGRDVERFLEDKNDLKLFDKELLKSSIDRVFGVRPQ